MKEEEAKLLSRKRRRIFNITVTSQLESKQQVRKLLSVERNRCLNRVQYIARKKSMERRRKLRKEGEMSRTSFLCTQGSEKVIRK